MVLGLSIVQYILSFIILDIHFGWIDDVFVMLQLKGEVISPQNGFFNLRGNNYFSYLYVWLYNNFGKLNWYGCFLSLYSLFCVININFILLHIVEAFGKHIKRNFFLISLAFFTAIVIENVYLLNFTRIAILLTTTSVLAISITVKYYLNKPIGKFLLAVFCLFFFIGWNCRLPAIMVFVPVIALFLFLFFRKRKKFLAIGVLGAFIILYISMAFLFLNDKNRKEFQAINHTEKYVHNILNAFNGKQVTEFTTPQDSIKTLALYRWYFADRDSVLNQDFLDEVGSNNPFSLKVLGKWKKNLNEEVLKAKHFYSKNYMPSMNWYAKTITLILIILIFPLLYIFFGSIDRYNTIKMLLFGIGVVVYVALITIFFKMEDRALAPLLVFTFLGCWLIANETHKFLDERILLTLVLVFAIMGTSRFQGYIDISKQRKYDLSLKSKVRSNLNKFYSDKIIFFDLYSLTILESHPLWNVKYPKNWTSGLEMFNLHSEEHHQNIEKTVGCLDWPCFFEEVAKTPDKYLFFYSNERIAITHSYNKIIYDEAFYFKKESENQLVNSLHYSFLWFPIGLGYYSLDTSIHDYQIIPERLESNNTIGLE